MIDSLTARCFSLWEPACISGSSTQQQKQTIYFQVWLFEEEKHSSLNQQTAAGELGRTDRLTSNLSTNIYQMAVDLRLFHVQKSYLVCETANNGGWCILASARCLTDGWWVTWVTQRCPSEDTARFISTYRGATFHTFLCIFSEMISSVFFIFCKLNQNWIFCVFLCESYKKWDCYC